MNRRAARVVRLALLVLVPGLSIAVSPVVQQNPLSDATTDVEPMTGLVVDEQGEPIEGARVWCALAEDPEPWPAPTHDRPLHEAFTKETYVADAAARWERSRQLSRSAVTGPDGRFTLSDLPADGQYRVDAALADQRISTWQIGLKRPGDEFTIAMRASHRVEVEVVDETGALVPDARIHVRASYSTSGGSWTPDDRWVESTQQAVTLTALRGNVHAVRSPFSSMNMAADWMSAPTPVDLLAERDGPVRLVLERPTWLEVRVDDPWRASGGESRCGIHLVPLAEGEELDPLDPRWKAGGQRWSGGDTISFLQLDPGRYGIVVRAYGTRVVGTAVVEVEPGRNTTRIRVEPPRPSNSVQVLVLDSQGRRLTESRVTIEQEVGGRWIRTRAQDSILSAEGVHWVPLENLDPNATRLRALVVQQGLGMVAAEGSLDQRQFTVEFPSAGRAELRLDGWAESNLRGRERITLRLEESHDGGVLPFNQTREVGAGRRAFVNDEGVVVIEGLMAGTWYVEVGADTASGPVSFYQRLHTIDPGSDVDIEVDYPNAAVVEVIATEALAGQNFIVMQAREVPPDRMPQFRHRSSTSAGTPKLHSIGADGTCELGELMTDRYRIYPVGANGVVEKEAWIEFAVHIGENEVTWQ